MFGETFALISEKSDEEFMFMRTSARSPLGRSPPPHIHTRPRSCPSAAAIAVSGRADNSIIPQLAGPSTRSRASDALATLWPFPRLRAYKKNKKKQSHAHNGALAPPGRLLLAAAPAPHPPPAPPGGSSPFVCRPSSYFVAFASRLGPHTHHALIRANMCAHHWIARFLTPPRSPRGNPVYPPSPGMCRL